SPVSTREPAFELGRGGGIERDRQSRDLAVVVAAPDLAVAVEPGNRGAVGKWYRHLARLPGAAEEIADRLEKLVDALPGQGRDGILPRALGAGVRPRLQASAGIVRHGIDLVQRL